jgi:hypothetical protein
MNEQDPKRRFQIVPSVHRSEITAKNFLAALPTVQANLFPVPRAGLLIFVFFTEVSEDEFRKTLEFAKPSVVVELRNAPRFDIGRLNRQAVFQYFDKEHSKYLDLTSPKTGQSVRPDLIDQIKESFNSNHVQFDKPIMFLFNSRNSAPDLSDRIIDLVSEMKKAPPEVLEVPHFVYDQNSPK